MKVLVSWIGTADLRAVETANDQRIGPIASAIDNESYDHVLLLADQSMNTVARLRKWLLRRTDASVEVVLTHLDNPMNYRDIYREAVRVIDSHLSGGSNPELTFHLSPGTSAMAATWIILAKTRYRATLIQSSIEHGVEVAEVPLEIHAELVEMVETTQRRSDEGLIKRTAADSPSTAHFGQIIYRCAVMRSLVANAKKAARRRVPILIEGESGTGKELFAKAIHDESNRDGPFVAANCGAIPPDLLSVELFGSVKGSFTGAVDRPGYFRDADKGTLFLDEIGELPLNAQVVLLRALAEGEVTPSGATKSVPVDVRILAATNRSLQDEVRAGRFREDLYYRLNTMILQIPALRDRRGDLTPLIDGLLQQINADNKREEHAFVEKQLSPGARRALQDHPWPGNIRELISTLTRVVIWSENAKLSAKDITDYLPTPPTTSTVTDGVLHRPLGNGFNIKAVLEEVKRHYVDRADREADGRQGVAAALLGLGNYQTFSNWRKKGQQT